MKKIGEMLFVCILAVVMAFFAFACGESGGNENSGGETGDGDTTINIHDAYENNRPDYEGGFGYETGYEPIVPPPPDKEVTLTLDTNSPITFADGSNTLTININSTLSAENFDLSGLDESETLGGFAFLQEDGTYGAASALESTSIPWEDAIIKPYFVPADYSYLRLEARINTDGIPVSPIRYPKLVTGTAVNGETYARKGIDIVTEGITDIGSALRFDAPFSIPESSSGTVYEYICNFENKSQYELHLDGYIISMSSEYKNGSFAYESRYRMDIDLAPGESATFNPQYSLMKNTNMLVYFVADRTMKDVNFGAAFYVKERADLSEPSVSTEPEEAAKSNITLELPEGITVTDSYVTELTAGDLLTVPTEEQITNTTGRTIDGWYYKNIFGLKFVDENTVAPDGELTLSPYFIPEIGTALTLGCGANNNLPDFFGALADITPDDLMGSVGYGNIAEVFTNNGTVIDGERGSLLTKEGTLDADDIFRFKTSAVIELNHKYRYTFDFTNYGEEDVTFELYQLQGQLLYSAEDYAVSQTVTVKKGESTTATIEITMNANNTNSLTLFRMIEATTSDLSLGVLMTMEDLGLDENNKRTLTIGGDYDVTFGDGNKTAEVLVGDPAPAVTVGEGLNRNVNGFYTVDKQGETTTSAVADFVMPAYDTTVCPYFSQENGYTELEAAGNWGGGVPNTGYSGGALTKDNFSKTLGTLVRGGKDGYPMIGKDIACNTSIAAGIMLRFDTAFSVTVNTFHYMFNFENKGTSVLSFDIWQVKSGTDTENGVQAERVTLQPGESTNRSITITYTGTNSNALTVIQLVEKADDFKLGVSMSAKRV